MKRFLPILVFCILLSLPPVTMAESTDYVFYSQTADGQKTIYLVRPDGSNGQVLVSGKEVKAFLIRKHLLYFINHQLFEYDPKLQKAKLLTHFNENQIYMKDLSDKPDAPDQALVLAEASYLRNYYILEFSDGSIRSVPTPYSTGSGTVSSTRSFCPDQTAVAVIRQASINYRFEISIQEKNGGKYKTSWTLPKTMTILPDMPLWAPNSRILAFYAKQFNGLGGFYSLYIYKLDSQELHLVQEQVFSKMSYNDLQMGSFTPEWSQDSQYLIFQYQPYGLPTGSLIIKYEVATDRKITLTNSRGHNLYPSWSYSGNSILFLSNRDSSQDQVYTMDSDGKNLKRLSPPEGYTEWACWYKMD